MKFKNPFAHNEAPQESDEDKVVVLFSSETQDGKPFFCYIQMTLAQFEAYSNATMQQKDPNATLDLTALGEIVAKGWGKMPTEEFHAKVLAKFGPVQQG